MIKARRSFLRFYVLNAVILLLCLSVAFAISLALKKNLKYGLSVKDCFGFIVVPSLIFLAFYTVYAAIKNVPIFTVEDNVIKLKSLFTKEIIALKEIEAIVFTGKVPYKHLLPWWKEGATIKLTDQREIHLFDDQYSNTGEVKTVLKELIMNEHTKSELEINFGEVETEEKIYFKGNPVFSLRGLSLWSLIILMGFTTLFKKGDRTNEYMLWPIFFSTFWFLFHCYLMHYFQITKNYLIIKTHYLLWINKVYKLDNIKEVVFESQGKMPHCLRVITHSFNTKLYPAGTLTDAQWLELKDQLQKRKVKVRNECVF